LLRTPLHQFHLDHGGKMVDFAGWEMPMMYTGIIPEHQQVRASGGVFDVSHMGRLKITGRHARRFLERVCTRKISDMDAGQCRYSLVCNERGGVRDDVIVYRMDDDDFLMVVNGANREKIVGYFDQVRTAGELAVKIDDQTLSTEKHFPLPRDDYATVLKNLESAGAAVVAFDVGFPDRSDNDKNFAAALQNASIPVVLAYGGSETRAADGKYVQFGPDQMPIKAFRCADKDTTSVTCSQPFKNVTLGSTDIAADADGVLRRIPMFVQPKCYGDGTCDTTTLNPLSFAAYNAFTSQGAGLTLTQSDGEARYAGAWTAGMPVDASGAAHGELISNYSFIY
jgi:hypothetical protein